MTTTLDRIHERAHTMRLGAALLSVLIWPLWLIGATAGWVWLAAKFVFGAIAVGFDDARGNRASGDG